MKLLLILLLPITLMAQQRKGFWLKQAGNATAMLIAGFADGQAEIIKNDYRRYAAIHPDANEQWANPKKSFVNKYKDWPNDTRPAYIGAKTWLAWTTDKYHLNRTIRNVMTATSIGINMTLYEKPNWKLVVLQAAISWASYAAGSGIAHNMYKPIQ